jgi:hypothetical protein
LLTIEILESLAAAKAIDWKSVEIVEGMRREVDGTVWTLLLESSIDSSELAESVAGRGAFTELTDF